MQKIEVTWFQDTGALWGVWGYERPMLGRPNTEDTAWTWHMEAYEWNNHGGNGENRRKKGEGWTIQDTNKWRESERSGTHEPMMSVLRHCVYFYSFLYCIGMIGAYLRRFWTLPTGHNITKTPSSSQDCCIHLSWQLCILALCVAARRVFFCHVSGGLGGCDALLYAAITSPSQVEIPRKNTLSWKISLFWWVSNSLLHQRFFSQIFREVGSCCVHVFLGLQKCSNR